MENNKNKKIFVCKNCGGVAHSRQYDYEAVGIREIKGYCFTCNFWKNQVKIHKEEPERRFVIKGRSYSVGSEDAPLKGFGGRKFAIKSATGLLIITTNLWDQGIIPDRFRNELPDNAKFEE